MISATARPAVSPPACCRWCSGSSFPSLSWAGSCKNSPPPLPFCPPVCTRPTGFFTPSKIILFSVAESENINALKCGQRLCGKKFEAHYEGFPSLKFYRYHTSAADLALAPCGESKLWLLRVSWSICVSGGCTHRRHILNGKDEHSIINGRQGVTRVYKNLNENDPTSYLICDEFLVSDVSFYALCWFSKLACLITDKLLPSNLVVVSHFSIRATSCLIRLVKKQH